MRVEEARLEPGSYRPRISASLQWESPQQAVFRWGSDGETANTFCNAVHAAAIAGALERVLDLSVRYANDRRQFGRAIGQFQAVQQELAVVAEQAGSAAVAARMGCAAAGLVPEPLLAAMAKLRASEAALRVATLAHAVHGAIGITEEHVLGVFTTRLHEWRAAGGGERACAEHIGRALLRSGQSFAGFMREALAPASVQV
jgi:acetyl-CoA C-acetyltransferase